MAAPLAAPMAAMMAVELVDSWAYITVDVRAAQLADVKGPK